MKDDGGAAFPAGFSHASNADCGMSLRDYFAGQVLIAMHHDYGSTPVDDGHRAKRCYEVADAMLKARGLADG